MPDDRLNALAFDYPEYIPVSVTFLPSVWMKYRDDLRALVERHPIIFGPRNGIDRDYDAVGGTYVEGEHIDLWGCTWSNVSTGFEAIVTGHPLPARESVREFRGPDHLLGRLPHGFMYLRLADLRGFEEIMIDFAEEPAELQMLIDIVLEHNVRELEQILAHWQGGPWIYFGDDLGMQHALPISPQKWRKYLKPCFMRLYGMCHDAGLYVYMHSDGHMVEIIPDLIECLVNIINPQVRANGLENIARTCKGKVCIDLDLDRQLFPFCTPDEIDAHVRECVETLGAPEGGLWLKASCTPDFPLENIEAICTALEKYRSHFSR